MTTRLNAINTMLSCIKQAPLNSLEGTKSYFTILAENILDTEVEIVQLIGWDFNSEDNYPLYPNENNNIIVTDDVLMLKLPSYYGNRYVTRNKKLYDKENHTFNITETLYASVVLKIEFDNLPSVAQNFITMSAANKFVKRALGSQATYTYTQEDLMMARMLMEEHELEVGNYSLIGEFYDGTVRGSLY